MFKRRPSPIPRRSLASDTSDDNPVPTDLPTPLLAPPPSDIKPARRLSSTNTMIGSGGGASISRNGRDSLGVGSRTFVSRLKERTSSLHLFERKPGAGVGGGDLRSSVRGPDTEIGARSEKERDDLGDEEGYLVIDDGGPSSETGTLMRRRDDHHEVESGSTSPASDSGPSTSTAPFIPTDQDEHSAIPATSTTKTTSGVPSIGRSSSSASLLRWRTVPKPLTMVKLRDEHDPSPPTTTSPAAIPATSTSTSHSPTVPLSASSHRSSFENIPQASRIAQPRQELPSSGSQRTLRSAAGSVSASSTLGKTSAKSVAGADSNAPGGGMGTPSRTIPTGLTSTSPLPAGSRRPATACSRLPRPNSIVPLRGSTSTSSVTTMATLTQSARRPSEKSESPQVVPSRRMSTGLAGSGLPGPEVTSARAKLRPSGARSSIQLRPRTSDGPSAMSIVAGTRQVSRSTSKEPAKSGSKPRRPVSMMMLYDGTSPGSLDSRQSSLELSGKSVGRRLSENGIGRAGGTGTPVVEDARRAALERLNGQGSRASEIGNKYGARSQTAEPGQASQIPLQSSTTTLSTPLRATARVLPNPRHPHTTATPTRLPRSVGLAQSTSMGLNTTPNRSSPLRPSPRPSPGLSASPSSNASSARKVVIGKNVTPSRSMPIPMPVTYGPSPLAQRLQHQPRFGSPANSLDEERDRKSSAASNASDIDVRMAKSLARHSMTFDGMVALGAGATARNAVAADAGHGEESPLTGRMRYPGIGVRADSNRSVGERELRTTDAGSDDRGYGYGPSGLNAKASFSGLSAVSIGSEDDIRTTGRVPSQHLTADPSDGRPVRLVEPASSSIATATGFDRANLVSLFSACTEARDLANAYDRIIMACEAELRVMEVEKGAWRMRYVVVEGMMDVVEKGLRVVDEEMNGEQEEDDE